MFILTLAHFIVLAMRAGTLFCYFQYYVDQGRLFDMLSGRGLTAVAAGSSGGVWHSLLNTFGLVVDANRSNVSWVGFSLLNMSGQFVTVAGVLCSTFLAMRFGKKAVALAGFSISAVFMTLFVLLPPQSLGTLFLLEYARALSYASTIPLLWAMFADVVDYVEWKTGRSTIGVIYATIIFGLTAGLSLGGAVTGWLLSGSGYRPNVAKTPEALQGIRMTISVYPAILFLIAIACLVSYKIYKKKNIQIQDELAEPRKKFAATS